MSLIVDIEKKLQDITLKSAFEIKETGVINGILGSSGCGKSMTLKCIAGIVTPDRGRIVLNERVLFDSEKGINLKVQERRAGYLFQNYALFPNMTICQNIEIVVKGNKQKKRQMAKEYMELFHVSDLAESKPGKLSGGQQQRAALARILASNPEVLMLDEPFSALDYYLKETIQLELLDILKSYQGDILMVTHNRDEIFSFCENIHVLDQGKLVVSGNTKEIFKEPGRVAAAKLTGCKNLVEVNRLSKHQLEVPVWGTVLNFKKEVPEDVEVIGVRAHYPLRSSDCSASNMVRCKMKKMVEDPFEVTVIMDNGIWWKVGKKTWDEFQKEDPQEGLVIPEESVLFLKR